MLDVVVKDVGIKNKNQIINGFARNMTKTIGELLDILSVTNCKIFYLVDKVQRNEHTKEDAKKIQDLNKYRSELVNAINEFFNERQEIKV